MNCNMKIVCKSNSKNTSSVLEAGQQVNRVGKYLYKNIDGALKIKFSPNMCDVYMMILYQIPRLQQIPGRGKEYNSMHEMILNLNITTYQNKLRVNIIEESPEERTLGHATYSPEKLMNLNDAQHLILNDIVKRLSKVYEEYDFLF